MKYKFHLAIAAMLAFTSAALAQTTQILTVCRLSSDEQKIALSKVGQILLADGEASLKLNGQEELVPLGPIADLSFAFGTGVITGQKINSQLSITVGPNPATDAVSISGLEVGSDIALIDRSGRALIRQSADAVSVTLSLAAFPADVYLLVAGGETFKIVKK